MPGRARLAVAPCEGLLVHSFDLGDFLLARQWTRLHALYGLLASLTVAAMEFVH